MFPKGCVDDFYWKNTQKLIKIADDPLTQPKISCSAVSLGEHFRAHLGTQQVVRENQLFQLAVA